MSKVVWTFVENIICGAHPKRVAELFSITQQMGGGRFVKTQKRRRRFQNEAQSFWAFQEQLGVVFENKTAGGASKTKRRAFGHFKNRVVNKTHSEAHTKRDKELLGVCCCLCVGVGGWGGGRLQGKP